MYPKHRVRALGGVASRADLFAHGCTRDEIDLSVRYGWILSVRKGLYADRDLDPVLLRAIRTGGRLTCMSALAWLEGRRIPPDEPLHVLVPISASRFVRGNAVVHWTRRHVEGSRCVVNEEFARAQADNCRGRRGASRSC